MSHDILDPAKFVKDYNLSISLHQAAGCTTVEKI